MHYARKTLGRLPRWMQFLLVGGTTFGLGAVLLYLLVSLAGVDQQLAFAIKLVVDLLLVYVLSRHVTWHDRHLNHLSVGKFLVARVATVVGSYYLFQWLTSTSFTLTIAPHDQRVTIGYMWANVICVGVTTVFNFMLSDRWVFDDIGPRLRSAWYYRIRTAVTVAAVVLAVGLVAGWHNLPGILLTVVALATFAMAMFDAWRMLYIFRNPEAVEQLQFPPAQEPTEVMAIIVPARHEAGLLFGTLVRLARQTHPNVVLLPAVCSDDPETMRDALQAAAQYPDRVFAVEYPLLPGERPTKPKQMNYVLQSYEAWLRERGVSIVGVIDAEDDVHPTLLARIDTVFRDPEIDVVQAGVQLMNYDTKWFSVQNCLEYFKWFSSIMAFQADSGFMPLGGNTVFVRYNLLRAAGGWPESLTEDCALGVQLSVRYGARFKALYDPELATREETPPTTGALVDQRTRWHQGFLRELLNGLWRELPSLRQRLLALYVLSSPVYQAFSAVMLPLTLASMIWLKTNVVLVMLMYLPLVPMVLQWVLNIVYLHDFSRAFSLKIRLRSYVSLVVLQPIYQVVLAFAGLWAMLREVRGNQTWVKTPHVGAHRSALPSIAVPATEEV